MHTGLDLPKPTIRSGTEKFSVLTVPCIPMPGGMAGKLLLSIIGDCYKTKKHKSISLLSLKNLQVTYSYRFLMVQPKFGIDLSGSICSGLHSLLCLLLPLLVRNCLQLSADRVIDCRHFLGIWLSVCKV